MENGNTFTIPGLQIQIPNNSILPPAQGQGTELKAHDISAEEYREYVFEGREFPYRIYSPKTLYVGKTTHRVLDSAGVVHCVPTVGERGCILRWKNREGFPPVQF